MTDRAPHEQVDEVESSRVVRREETLELHRALVARLEAIRKAQEAADLSVLHKALNDESLAPMCAKLTARWTHVEELFRCCASPGCWTSEQPAFPQWPYHTIDNSTPADCRGRGLDMRQPIWQRTQDRQRGGRASRTAPTL